MFRRNEEPNNLRLSFRGKFLLAQKVSDHFIDSTNVLCLQIPCVMKRCIFVDLFQKMDTEAVTAPSYKGVAFRLPALQRDTSSDAKDKYTRGRKGCPRELRVAAASEDSVMAKQKRLALQRSRALMKRKREEDRVEDKTELPRDDTSELPDLGLTSSALMDAADAMGYLVRELTV